MDVSVIIVNFNTHEHLKKCIKSIIEFSVKIEYEIIVVDNNSSEKGIEDVAKIFPQVKVIYNKDNSGFGSGCNIGVKNSKGKYCVFVNPDIIFTSDTLTRLTDFMNEDSKCGVCGGILRNESGEMIYTYNYFPGFFWEFIQALGFGTNYLIGKLNSKLNLSENYKYEVDWLIGAFLFIRRSVFESVKGFDEDFFLYYEDVDIQLRVKNSGYRIYCVKDADFMHYERSSVRSLEGENTYYYHLNKSKIIYMEKHFNFLKRKSIYLMHITGTVLRMLTLYIRPKFHDKRNQKFKQYKVILNLYLTSFF